MRRRSYPSLAQRLHAELDQLEDRVLDVVARSGISAFDAYGGMLITAARYQWTPSDRLLTADRMRVLTEMRQSMDRLRGLFPHPTPQVRSTLKDAAGLVERWLERPSAHDDDLPATVAEAQQVVQDQIGALRELVELAAGEESGPLRLIPDTNSLLRNPDLATYHRAVGTSGYDVHIVPTVLRELDQIKDRGASPEVRDKAQAFVRRLKGLRDKGSLAAGVALTRAVTIRAEPRDIDPRELLDWLDPTVPDDRILGSALELQRRHPGAPVVLVTSDLNLQNKADAAGVPYAETPQPSSALRAVLSPTLGVRPSAEMGTVRTVTLTNDGPRPARNIRYQVESPTRGPGQLICGPWEVEVLAVGAADVRDLAIAGPEALVVATWEDDEQQRDQRWVRSF